MQQKELKIDPELRDLLPPLTDDEYKQLEKNIVENGFDRNFPIMEWHGFIVDGHNRYSICKKHNIDYVVGTLAYETKDEVMEWMLDIQLGRRNLTPIQRIAVAEKYRPIYERQALLNKQSAIEKARRYNENNINEQFSQNSSTTVSNNEKIDVRAKLAKTAGVSTDTYSKGKKILDSDNDQLKKEVLSGEKSINAAYKELQDEKKKVQSFDNLNGEYNIESSINKRTIQQEKPIIENGVVLIDEKNDDDKMMNDIARRMKSGQIDFSKITNESEFNNIKKIVNDNINSIISYVNSNINFKEFNSSDLENLREIINDAINKMNKLLNNMEDILNE